MPSWRRLLMQLAPRPASVARLNAGSNNAARMPMTAITTSNSISVKARRDSRAVRPRGERAELGMALCAVKVCRLMEERLACHEHLGKNLCHRFTAAEV